MGERERVHKNRLSMPADHRDALGRMQRDADIASEEAGLVAAMHGLAVGAAPSGGVEAPTAQGYSAVSTPLRHVRLNWLPGQGGHQPSPETIRLLREVGGRPAIARFADAFYALAFRDPHLDRFIRDRSDPHGVRFADWITEKFGDGTPWSTERAGTSVCVHTRMQEPAQKAPARYVWHIRVCTTPRHRENARVSMSSHDPRASTPAPTLAHRRRDPLKHVEQCLAQDARHVPFNPTARPFRRRTTGGCLLYAHRHAHSHSLTLSPGRAVSLTPTVCFSVCPPLSSLTSCPTLPSRRSSAHFAAWHSPKREPEKFGLHFKLDDCRVWMRCVPCVDEVCA